MVTPAHEIREVGRPGAEAELTLHNQRRDLRGRLGAFYQNIRRNLWSSALVIDALAPAVLPVLAGKIFAPRQQGRLAGATHRHWVPHLYLLPN